MPDRMRRMWNVFLILCLFCISARSDPVDPPAEMLKLLVEHQVDEELAKLHRMKDKIVEFRGDVCGIAGYVKKSITDLAGTAENVYADMARRENMQSCDGSPRAKALENTVSKKTLVHFIVLLVGAVGCLYIYDYWWKHLQHAEALEQQEQRYTDRVMKSFSFNPKSQLEVDKLQGIQDKRMLNRSVSLEFTELSLRVKDGRQYKTVLKGVTGKMESGKMCAIMGPSGAGKTSFMNTLCGKAGYGKREGKLKIVVGGGGLQQEGADAPAGQEFDDMSDIKTIMGFVPQDDVVHENLTVSEQITFSAQLRAAPGTSPHLCKKIMEDVLHVLQIRHIRNTIVGGQEQRGISGGQRKRVNIGLELAADPSLLFLDEPTSGLDSTSSFAVIKSLQNMSTLGLTSIMVIHQPRYSLFKLFDEILLLGVGGRTVYQGSAQKVSKYFEDMGFKMPAEENPADWLMDVVSEQTEQPPKNLEGLFTHWEKLANTDKEGWRATDADNALAVEAGDANPDSADIDIKSLCHVVEEAWDSVDKSEEGRLEQHEVAEVLACLEDISAELTEKLFTEMSDQSCQGKTYYLPMTRENGEVNLVRATECCLCASRLSRTRTLSGSPPERFRVESEIGVAFRTSKDYDCRELDILGPRHGAVIEGFDDGDGWIKTQAEPPVQSESWCCAGVSRPASASRRVSRQVFVRYFRESARERRKSKAQSADDVSSGTTRPDVSAAWSNRILAMKQVISQRSSCLTGLCASNDPRREPLLGDADKGRARWNCLHGCICGCCQSGGVSRRRRGCLGQFKILMHRQFVQWARARAMRMIFLAVCCVAALVLAATDMFVSKQEAWHPEVYLNLHTALALLSSVYCLSVFNSDRGIFWRECSTGLNVHAFYWARVLTNAVDMAMMSFAVGGLYYVLIRPPIEFHMFFWPMILVGFASSGIGFFLGALFPPQHGPFVAAVLSFVSCGLLGHPLKIRQFMSLGPAPEVLIDLTSITRWSVAMSFAKAVEVMKPQPTSLRTLSELNVFKDIYLKEPRFQEGIDCAAKRRSFCTEDGVWDTAIIFLIAQGLLYRCMTLPMLKFRDRDKKV